MLGVSAGVPELEDLTLGNPEQPSQCAGRRVVVQSDELPEDG